MNFSRDDAVQALTNPEWKEPLAWVVALANNIDPIAITLKGEKWVPVLVWDPKLKITYQMWRQTRTNMVPNNRYYLNARTPTWGDVLRLRLDWSQTLRPR